MAGTTKGPKVAVKKTRRGEPPVRKTWWQQVGERVALIRKTRGITLEHLAEVTDTRLVVLEDLEAGGERILPDRLYRVAHALGVTYRDITPPFAGPVLPPGAPVEARDVPMRYEPLEETMEPEAIWPGVQEFLDRHAESLRITPMERWHLANDHFHAPRVVRDDAFWMAALKFIRQILEEERAGKVEPYKGR